MDSTINDMVHFAAPVHCAARHKKTATSIAACRRCSASSWRIQGSASSKWLAAGLRTALDVEFNLHGITSFRDFLESSLVKKRQLDVVELAGLRAAFDVELDLHLFTPLQIHMYVKKILRTTGGDKTRPE
jgi:hypothetical protein